jgi:hypothetical protein
MRHWSILIAIPILSSFIIDLRAVGSETQQIEFAPNSQGRQDAQTRQINFTLNTQSAQTFADLMQQAELVATNLIRQGFAQNPSVKEMSVSILAERNGQEVPLLMSKVARPDWHKQPIVPQWTRYFYSSAVLLGFLNPSSEPSPPSEPGAKQFPSTPAQPPSQPTPTSGQPTPPAASPSPTPKTPPAPPSSPASETSRPGGASLEENDPGYR